MEDKQNSKVELNNPLNSTSDNIINNKNKNLSYTSPYDRAFFCPIVMLYIFAVAALIGSILLLIKGGGTLWLILLIFSILIFLGGYALGYSFANYESISVNLDKNSLIITKHNYIFCFLNKNNEITLKDINKVLIQKNEGFQPEEIDIHYELFDIIFKLNDDTEIKGITNISVEKDECLKVIGFARNAFPKSISIEGDIVDKYINYFD